MADESDDTIRWGKKDAFVLPVLPKSLKLDPLLAAVLHLMAFLELSGDDAVDPDWAVETMEHVGHYLAQLTDAQVAAIQEQVGRVVEHARKKKWGRKVVQFLNEFLENVGEVDE